MIAAFFCGFVLGVVSGIGFGLYTLSRLMPKPTNIGGVND